MAELSGWSLLHSPPAMWLVAALLAVAVFIALRRRREAERIAQRYRSVVEQSPDAIWLAERGRLQLVNAAGVALLGARTADELQGLALAEFLPAAATQALHAGEQQARRLDGSLVDVELALAEVPDHGGPALQGIMRDIGVRKRAEAELQATQAALRQAQALARLGYGTLDVASARWTLSPTLAEVLGLPPERTLKLDQAWWMVHPDDRAALQAYLSDEVLTGLKPYDREFRITRADDGQLRWLHVLGRVENGPDGRAARLFVTVQDITERKLSTLALEHSREELRRLSAAIADAREHERRRVARELHDELGQRLSALKLDLAALCSQPAPADAAEAERRLQPLLAAVDGAVAATRRIASDLRPAMLDDLGLAAALEWLAADWRRRGGMEISLATQIADGGLTDSAATTLYRIVQEALTNVSRHARARHVAIRLERHERELLVSVEDDGRGLEPGATTKRDSSGLAGIRERARMLGGSASVRNRSQGGCRLEVRLPLERIVRTVDELDEAGPA